VPNEGHARHKVMHFDFGLSWHLKVYYFN